MATADARPPIPVTLLSGFLGAGKTTTLRRLLSCGLRLGVIVNDMAEINMDAEAVGAVAGEADVVALSNGCICCTKRDDLAGALLRLSASALDAIVVESSGVSEPMPVAEAFTFEDTDADGRRLCDVVRLDTCVTLVDAEGFSRDLSSVEALRDRSWATTPDDARSVVNLLMDQVEFADVLVLNKADRVDAATLARVRGVLRGLNPHAHILTCEFGQVPIDAIIRTGAFDLSRAASTPGWLTEARGAHVPETLEYGIASFVFRARRPFSAERLCALVRGRRSAAAPDDASDTAPGCDVDALNDVIRSKGVFWLAVDGGWEDACVWASAGNVYEFSLGSEWLAMTPGGDWDDVPASVRERVLADWHPELGDRRQEIVVIGLGMDEDRVRAALQWALLTDAEFAAGPDAWKTFPDPIDVIMEEVDTDEENAAESGAHVHGPHCGHDASHNVEPGRTRILVTTGGFTVHDATDSAHDHDHDNDEHAPPVKRIIRGQ